MTATPFGLQYQLLCMLIILDTLFYCSGKSAILFTVGMARSLWGFFWLGLLRMEAKPFDLLHFYLISMRILLRIVSCMLLLYDSQGICEDMEQELLLFHFFTFEFASLHVLLGYKCR